MKKIKRLVIKVGTKVMTSADKALDSQRIGQITSQVSDLLDDGIEVLIVTSGAIGAGMWLLGLKKRPSKIFELQAAAAIGQGHLMHLYGEHFKSRGRLVGQILLTQDDFDDRRRYLNIKHTIDTLIEHKAVPIINENDTVATEEIKCGDNDRISMLLSDLVRADTLILLTDVDGLLDENGRVIRLVNEITPKILRLAGKSGCDLGTGGMATKLASAMAATEAGIDCIIANGAAKDAIRRAVTGDIGTLFTGGAVKFLAKKRWIAYSSKAKGALRIDDGACAALKKNKSLLASGIVSVEGTFDAGDTVNITGTSGSEVARGIVNYSSKEIFKIKGLKSGSFGSSLGHKGPDEVIHRDNLVML